MDNLNKSRDIKFIFLPNFNISNTFDSSAIGVFVGIFTGIIIELLVNNEWECENVSLMINSIIAIFLLWGAIKQNNIVKELCEDIKFKDNENKFITVSSVLNELWEQQDFEKKYLYRKHKNRFYLFLYTSFFIVILSAALYVYLGTLKTYTPAKSNRIELICDTVKFQSFQQLEPSCFLNFKHCCPVKNSKITTDSNRTCF